MDSLEGLLLGGAVREIALYLIATTRNEDDSESTMKMSNRWNRSNSPNQTGKYTR